MKIHNAMFLTILIFSLFINCTQEERKTQMPVQSHQQNINEYVQQQGEFIIFKYTQEKDSSLTEIQSILDTLQWPRFGDADIHLKEEAIYWIERFACIDTKKGHIPKI